MRFIFERVSELKFMSMIVDGLWRFMQRLTSYGPVVAALGSGLITFHVAAQDAGKPPGEDLYVQGLEWMANNELYRAQILMEQAIKLNPNNAGAYMDLSLIYCQLGEVAKANDMWEEIETRFSPPATLVEVIRRERTHGCVAAKSQSEVEFEVTRGHSSNINQGVKSLGLDIPTVSGLMSVQLLPQFGQTADDYTQMNGVVKSAATADGVQAQMSMQLRENDRVKNLNILTLGLDVAKRQELSLGRLEWGAGLGQANLGEVPFQRHAKLRLNWRPHLQPIQGWDAIFGISVTQIDYPAFESMSSQPLDIQVTMAREWVGARFEAYGQLSKDKGSANRPGGNKDGTRLGFNLVKALGRFSDERLFAKLGWDGQSWRSASAYSPGFIDESRQQFMSTAIAAIVWPQTRTELWSIEARHQRNFENIKIFEYEAKTIQLSYRKTWDH